MRDIRAKHRVFEELEIRIITWANEVWAGEVKTLDDSDENIERWMDEMFDKVDEHVEDDTKGEAQVMYCPDRSDRLLKLFDY